MQNKIRLFSYKMTDDTGFAPNPFHGFLTLACCKPGIRETKVEGDWIAGFTSKYLNGDAIGEERLIYIMKVDCKITFHEYWNEKKYQIKKPILNSKDKNFRFGDNIYQPDSKSSDGYKQIQNCCHNSLRKDDDLKSKYVLVSKEYYYFGGKPIKIKKSIRPNVPKYSTNYGYSNNSEVKSEALVNFIKQKFKMGIINLPSSWNSSNNNCG